MSVVKVCVHFVIITHVWHPTYGLYCMMNFENFENHSSASRPACLPAVKPGSAMCRGLEIMQNNCLAYVNLCLTSVNVMMYNTSLVHTSMYSFQPCTYGTARFKLDTRECSTRVFL